MSFDTNLEFLFGRTKSLSVNDKSAQYDSSNDVIDNVFSSETDTYEPFMYSVEMQSATTQRARDINSYLTTKDFEETMKLYYPGERPDLPGYASTVGPVYYEQFSKLNDLLIDKNNKYEFLAMIFNHYKSIEDYENLSKVFDVLQYYNYNPGCYKSEDKYGNSVDDFEHYCEDVADVKFAEYAHDMGVSKNDWGVETDENGNFTSMFIKLDGITYSVEQKYFEDSSYPLARRETKTDENGQTTSMVTIYNYDERGVLTESQTDSNSDNIADTIIYYDGEDVITGFVNLSVDYIHRVNLSSEVQSCVMNGDFGYTNDGKMTLDSEGNLIVTEIINGQEVSITMDSEGYIKASDLYKYMNENRKDSPLFRVIDQSEFAEFRFTDEGLEKRYNDGSVVLYDKEGKVISGKDRLELDQDISINEKIDEPFRQGLSGDCWLLSGLYAFSITKEGRKAIKKAISKIWFSDDYNVKLGGKKYKVTNEELEKAKSDSRYSYGDDDVILMEVAFEKYLSETEQQKQEELQAAGKNYDPLNGGTFEKFTVALTGKETGAIKQNSYDLDSNFDNIFNYIDENPNGVAAIVSFIPEDENSKIIATDSSGKEIVMANSLGHAWSVLDVNGQFITLVNPWDTTMMYTFSRSELKEKSSQISFYEF